MRKPVENKSDPLTGVKIIDFTSSVAGPWATLILASLGADIVKVEHPDRGDDTRHWGPPFWGGESTAFLAMNAAKKSVALNLKTARGSAAALRLIEDADVLIQNMRPGLMDKFGLSFEKVAVHNERIIYCSIGAYGPTGPLSGEPGYDPLMQASSGIMSVTGEEGRPPVRAGVSVVDQGAGFWAAIGILASLLEPRTDRRPRLIDTSLYETAVNWLPIQVAGYLASGDPPRRMGSGMAVIAPYEAFQTSDGRWIMIAAGNDRLFHALCTAIEAPQLLEDERYRSNADRVRNRTELSEALTEVLLGRPAAVWVERCQRAGVPASFVQNVAEMITAPQTRDLELLQTVAHPAVDDLILVRPALRMNGQPLNHRHRPPRLGEHTEECLRDVGYGDSELADMRADGTIA
jgi:crotonobetainyl-CoA:carnitine CoA-transferase CaiB-like acyl-CoA transferase